MVSGGRLVNPRSRPIPRDAPRYPSSVVTRFMMQLRVNSVGPRDDQSTGLPTGIDAHPAW